jgi:hypothetical protein
MPKGQAGKERCNFKVTVPPSLKATDGQGKNARHIGWKAVTAY